MFQLFDSTFRVLDCTVLVCPLISHLNDMATNEEGSPLPLKEHDKKLSDGYYARSYSRLSKENLFMILALLMEDFVDEKADGFRKVGAVLVLPNDVVCAADCTRDGVHAVERMLIKHFDKAEGSNVFMSRKPCPVCAKLLVQTKVKRVLYLPFEPEYYISPTQNPGATTLDETQIEEGGVLEETATAAEQTEKKNAENMQQVDNIFTASPIAQTKFVLQVHKVILDEKEEKKKTPTDEINMIEQEQGKLVCKYPTKWMDYKVSRRALNKHYGTTI